MVAVATDAKRLASHAASRGPNIPEGIFWLAEIRITASLGQRSCPPVPVSGRMKIQPKWPGPPPAQSRQTAGQQRNLTIRINICEFTKASMQARTLRLITIAASMQVMGL